MPRNDFTWLHKTPRNIANVYTKFLFTYFSIVAVIIIIFFSRLFASILHNFFYATKYFITLCVCGKWMLCAISEIDNSATLKNSFTIWHFGKKRSSFFVLLLSVSTNRFFYIIYILILLLLFGDKPNCS